LVLLILHQCSSAGSLKVNARALTVKRQQCIANIKQLITAQLIYSADHRGEFCPSYLDYKSTALNNVWMGALASYHGRTNGVWLCPSATNPPTHFYKGTADSPWTYTDRESDASTVGSYALNGYLGLGRNYRQSKAATFKTRNVFRTESAVLRPAATPGFCDAIYWNCRLEETDIPSRNLYQPQGIVAAPDVLKILTQVVARHGEFAPSEAPRETTSNFLPGAINVAFVDGHAATIPLEDLWKFYWHKNWDLRKVPFPHPAPQ
jgi:prepilin-type processing-associated H-X9-DG protein